MFHPTATLTMCSPEPTMSRPGRSNRVAPNIEMHPMPYLISESSICVLSKACMFLVFTGRTIQDSRKPDNCRPKHPLRVITKCGALPNGCQHAVGSRDSAVRFWCSKPREATCNSCMQVKNCACTYTYRIYILSALIYEEVYNCRKWPLIRFLIQHLLFTVVRPRRTHVYYAEAYTRYRR